MFHVQVLAPVRTRVFPVVPVRPGVRRGGPGAEPEPDGDLLRRRDQGRPGTGLFQTLRAKRRRAGGRRRIQRRNGQGEGHGRRRQGQLGRGRGGEPRTAPRLRRGAVRTPRPGAFRRPRAVRPRHFQRVRGGHLRLVDGDGLRLDEAGQGAAVLGGFLERPRVPRQARPAQGRQVHPGSGVAGRRGEGGGPLQGTCHPGGGQPRLRQARPAQAEHPVVGGRRPAAAMAGGRRRGDERGLQRAHRRCAEGGGETGHRLARQSLRSGVLGGGEGHAEQGAGGEIHRLRQPAADAESVLRADPLRPVHKGTLALLPKTVQEALPTAPANLEGARAVDAEFWVDHGEELEQRFNAWAAR